MSAVDWLGEVGENDVPSVHQMGAMSDILGYARPRLVGRRFFRFGWEMFFCFGILFDTKWCVETFLTDTFSFKGHYDSDNMEEDIEWMLLFGWKKSARMTFP